MTRVCSEETKAKLRQAQLGRKHSQETCDKMSATHLAMNKLHPRPKNTRVCWNRRQRDPKAAVEYFVYGLYDIRNPKKIQYYGVTSQELKKRLSDHRAEAKFKVRNGLLMSAKMDWVMQVLDDDSDIGIKSIRKCSTREEAELAEQALIKIHRRSVTNSRIKNAGGRPVGSLNDEAALRNIRRAAKKRWERIHENRIKGTDFDTHLQIACEWRRYLGLPFPEQPIDRTGPNVQMVRQLKRKGKYIRLWEFKVLYKNGKVHQVHPVGFR